MSSTMPFDLDPAIRRTADGIGAKILEVVTAGSGRNQCLPGYLAVFDFVFQQRTVDGLKIDQQFLEAEEMLVGIVPHRMGRLHH